MRGFKTPASTQRFLSSMGGLLNLLKVKRYIGSAKEYRKKLQEALAVFQEIVTSCPQSI